MTQMNIVNSHNEWDQLEEVIVGDGFPETIPTFKVFFHDNIFGKNFDPKQYIKKRHVVEHKEDIEQFVELLRSLDIIVKRPKVPKKVFKTNFEKLGLKLDDKVFQKLEVVYAKY